jgi:hypothetical protein
MYYNTLRDVPVRLQPRMLSSSSMTARIRSGGKWYFFNELWSDIYGPFDTEEEANQGCKEYADSLEVVTVDDN